MSNVIENIIEKYELTITGMRCSGCSNNIETTLKKMNFVKSITVNLVLEKALLVVDAEILKLEKEKNYQSENQNIVQTYSNIEMIKSIFIKLGFGVNNISKIKILLIKYI